MARKTSFVVGPASDAHKKFMALLQKAAEGIIKEAKGRVCGTCSFFRGEWCARHVSVLTEIEIHCLASSIACRFHTLPPT